MTGIFYGSTTGTTEAVAQDIAKQLGVQAADVHNVADASADETDKYDLDALKAKDLTGKQVALFGCGDSGSYPDTFCDALGLIYEGLQGTGCTFVGAYTPEGYDVTDSLVCSDGKFVGLAIDESDPGKTDARLAAWCESLKNA